MGVLRCAPAQAMSAAPPLPGSGTSSLGLSPDKETPAKLSGDDLLASAGAKDVSGQRAKETEFIVSLQPSAAAASDDSGHNARKHTLDHSASDPVLLFGASTDAPASRNAT